MNKLTEEEAIEALSEDDAEGVISYDEDGRFQSAQVLKGYDDVARLRLRGEL